MRQSHEGALLPDCVLPSVKRGDDLIIAWECFLATGIGYAVRID